MSESDETAHASLVRHVDLEAADQFLLGWRDMVLRELDQMRSELPFADTLVLRLECVRRSDSLG